VSLQLIANTERICEEAEFDVLPLHLHSKVDYGFSVEK
jgi:hypothetical protein